MTKGYDAWDVLNVLVNRVKVNPDYKPNYDEVRRLLCSISDTEWDYILDQLHPPFKPHPEGCDCPEHSNHNWLK